MPAPERIFSTSVVVAVPPLEEEEDEEEENDRYSRLHQPVLPDEVFTFTHPLLLVPSTTVSFVPLGSTCKTE